MHVICLFRYQVVPASCWLTSHPAFLSAGVPGDSRRSQYDLILVPPGSQSHHTVFWFTDRYHKVGKGQDAAHRDGPKQGHQAGRRWRHVSYYYCAVLLELSHSE